jgi:hypothetical protein
MTEPGRRGGSSAASGAHMLWIPVGQVVGFLAALVFGDVLTLPVDVYYLVYFALVIGFFGLYVKTTHLDLGRWISRRLALGIVLGLTVGAVMLRNVLSRPETAHLEGAMLWWAILWRGVVYGTVDGILLFAFPWIVTWRAFDAESRGLGTRWGWRSCPGS